MFELFPGLSSGTSPREQDKNRTEAVLRLVDDLYPIKAVVPHYHSGIFGDWSLSINNPDALQGYFLGYQRMTHENPVLKRDDTVWMSVTPMEVESHLHHINQAKGKVVVGGLGMGFYLHNICKKADVTEVVVIERDAEVIKLFKEIAQPHHWQGWDKVSIIHADIINHKLPVQLQQADYLYVDIWPALGGEEAQTEMTLICEQLNPKQAGFWGQELLIQQYLEDAIGINPWLADGTLIEQYIDDKNIPLFSADTLNERHFMRDYVTLCAATASLQGY